MRRHRRGGGKGRWGKDELEDAAETDEYYCGPFVPGGEVEGVRL